MGPDRNSIRASQKHAHSLRLLIAAVCFTGLMNPVTALAGPPFLTDDPEPVEYKHWEVYLASQYRYDRDSTSATAPHIEVNYGAAPNLQLHLILPMQYVKPRGEASQYGYGDTEIGLKYRFVQETDWCPMIGVFPLLEIPTGDESKGLGNGDPQFFMPIWLQKSWGPWTTYGGGGYWINPGEGNQNFWFVGWEIQRKITEKLSLGTEFFHKSASEVDGDSETGFNIGAIIDFTALHHLLLSAGRDFSGPNRFSSYIAYQLTIGP